ncbi:L,D-transpeptidase [uncultured Bosea sp.]|uniref:L,D-transpeptidase n=1 Tax=uncultured Bosea sp. TaxID=211457 RepID=UPI0025EE1773|nr:L,D-transpeptidase [uncultured Bosea sp.]
MRRVLGILAVLFLSAFAGAAHAGVDVRVDIPAQRMSVTTTDGEAYEWKISSGRQGFRSPNGVYRPTRLEKNWYSRKYGGAMPYAVFFRGGYAIHGTGAVGALGRPASHGCIRLHPANAAKLFALVKKYGAGQTRIALHGAAPDNLSRFAKASSSSKTKIAKAHSSKHKIAKAKQRSQATSVAQQRRNGNWEAARGQILLRPALPVSAYGYQPYYPSGYGWR